MSIKYDSSKGMFEVYRKTKEGKQHFGYYHTKEAAKKIVTLLKKVEWEYSHLSPSAKKFFQKKGLNDFPITKNKKTRRKAKYYYYNKQNKKWIVQKSMNQKQRVFGSFDSEEDAKKYVEMLKKYNWDINNINPAQPKYYTKKGGKYVVFKTFNQKQYVYGKYDTEDEAKKAVEYFKQRKWDMDLVLKSKPKYYSPAHNSYLISKTINGKAKYFGNVHTEDDAKMVVEDLMKNNWDEEKISPESKKLLNYSKFNDSSHYSYNSKRGFYSIQKYIDSKLKFIGYVKKEEDALKVIEELKKCGWDRNKLSMETRELLLNKFRNEPNYYTRTPEGKYRITKRINGAYMYFGVYDTREEAEDMVEILKQNNWNRNILPRQFKQYDTKKLTS